MTIFEAVKTTVAPRMAAEHFGLSVSRNGMVCCPFHDDRHPSMKLYVPNLPIHEDRLHVANGTLFLNGEFTEHKEFCRNRLPVKYDADAPQPVTWLHFLSELLEDEDILTLQEYLGYCLLPTNRGQTMMLLKGNGGEGKSRIGVVMQKLLGDNLKNGSIAKVERSPFARADLEHQLVMVDDDMKLDASLFCPADEGQATQRQRNRWQQEKTDMVAG